MRLKVYFILFCLVVVFLVPLDSGAKNSILKRAQILTVPADESQLSVIYMHLPYRGYGAIAFNGPDTAVDYKSGSNIIGVNVHKGGRSVTFKNAADKKGDGGTLHILTKAGRTHSIVTVSFGRGANSVSNVAPKVVIQSK